MDSSKAKRRASGWQNGQATAHGASKNGLKTTRGFSQKMPRGGEKAAVYLPAA